MSEQEWKPSLDEVEMTKILVKGTLIGIPLVAAALAGAFNRSRLPSERPAE